MDKKIGKNISSGAQKVERVEQTPAQQARAEAQAAEHAAAEARYEAAKVRAAKKEAAKTPSRKERALQEKLKKKEERLERRAEAQSAKAEKRAAKAARREMLRQESAAEKKTRMAREKRERLAQKRKAAQEKEARLAEKQAQRRRRQEQRSSKDKSGGKKRAPGIGGWIAAVSILGAACLALSAVVTVGSFRMAERTMQAANGYRATLYELVSVSEDMDDSFAKLRISSGAGEQRALLTDILVDAALMEDAIARFPIDAATSTDMSAFVNRTGMNARAMLRRITADGALGARELERIGELYEINAGLCAELNDLALHTPDKELAAFFEGGAGSVSERFSQLGQSAAKRPEEIGDAPFAGEGNVGQNAVIGLAEVSSARAEEAVRRAFAPYHVADVRMTGETLARSVRAYNFVVTDEAGAEYFAQVTKNGGKLVFFDSDTPCSQHNFSLENCTSLAQEFLSSLGYDGLTPVWFSEAGNVASVTFVADIGGVRAYPDMIRVRVCEERGRVVGMDAHAYAGNHHGTRDLQPGISQEEARANLSSQLCVQEAHLALIPLGGREMLTYEFLCRCGEEEYLLYLDADTGEEVRIFRVHESAQGSYLA